MEHQYGNFSVLTQPILIRSRHHTAAVEFAVHDRGKPYFLITVAFTVHNDSRVFRLKVKQQPGDRDLCVVDRLRLFPVLVLFPQLFSNFTAIAVDTEADVIKEQAGFSLYIYTRETLKIRIEAYGRIRKWFLIDISRKIVAGSRRIVVEACSDSLFRQHH